MTAKPANPECIADNPEVSLGAWTAGGIEMQERIVPWWRRALEFAFGGIRTGFGLFSRPAHPDPVKPREESRYLDRPKESLEVETVLTDQPNPKTLRVAAETVAASTPATESTAEAAAEPVPEIVAKLKPADPVVPPTFAVDAADAIDLAGSVGQHRAKSTAAEQPVEPTAEGNAETASAVSSAPLNEHPLATAIEPSAEPEQEITPPTEPEVEQDQPQQTEAESVAEVFSAAETVPVAVEPTREPETTLQPELDAQQDSQQEPETEPTAEDLTAADPIPAAEPTPAGQPLAIDEPDPLQEQSIEPVHEVIEVGSHSTDLLPELPAAPASPAEEVRDAEVVPAAEQLPEPQAAPVTQPANAAPEPAPVSASASSITPAVEAPEPAPVPETPPPPTPKPFIKLESRDDEANLSPFSVVVEQVYDGPLDLLLDLIRKQDIDVYDIPIAKITAQFLAYVNQLKASDVDVAGDFIYIASLLIHIKSRMLLPRTPSGPEEAVEDPRHELVERLLEHERFKNAAQMLQQKQMLEAASWTNPGFREFQDDVAAEPEIAADTVDLVRVFRDVLERIRSRPVFDLDEDSVTVGQMIQFLARRLTMEDKPVALRRLLSHTRSERALIAIFLALLELVRLQAVLLRQDRVFSEIFIKKHTGFDAVMNEGLANAHDDWK